jgi:hypothetical protein
METPPASAASAVVAPEAKDVRILSSDVDRSVPWDWLLLIAPPSGESRT